MRVTGSMIEPKEEVHTFIWMVLNTSGNGKTINNMVKALNLGQMVQSMKELTKMARKSDSASSNGLTNLPTPATFLTITSTERASTLGAMVVSTRVSGESIKCMETATSLGGTDAATMENTLMTKRVAMESFFGPTADITKENGEMVSSMARVCLLI